MQRSRIERIEQRIAEWRARHPDAASRRAAYQAKVLDFTLSSMALENEPVDPQRLKERLARPTR